MANKQIYLVYSCDADKSQERLVLATTSAKRVRDFIVASIRSGDMRYVDSDRISAEKMFFRDWNKAPRGVINSRLQYGYFDYVYDGVEI